MKKILSIVLLFSSYFVHAAAEDKPIICPPGVAERLVQVVPGLGFPPHALLAVRSQAGEPIYVYLLAHKDQKLRDGVVHDIEEGQLRKHTGSFPLAELVKSRLREGEKQDGSNGSAVVGQFCCTRKQWQGAIQTISISLSSMQVVLNEGNGRKVLTRLESGCALFRLTEDGTTWKHTPRSVSVSEARTFDVAIRMQEKGKDLKLIDTPQWYTVFKRKSETALVIDTEVMMKVFDEIKNPEQLAAGMLLAQVNDLEASVSESNEEQSLLARRN